MPALPCAALLPCSPVNSRSSCHFNSIFDICTFNGGFLYVNQPRSVFSPSSKESDANHDAIPALHYRVRRGRSDRLFHSREVQFIAHLLLANLGSSAFLSATFPEDIQKGHAETPFFDAERCFFLIIPLDCPSDSHHPRVRIENTRIIPALFVFEMGVERVQLKISCGRELVSWLLKASPLLTRYAEISWPPIVMEGCKVQMHDNGHGLGGFLTPITTQFQCRRGSVQSSQSYDCSFGTVSSSESSYYSPQLPVTPVSATYPVHDGFMETSESNSSYSAGPTKCDNDNAYETYAREIPWMNSTSSTHQIIGVSAASEWMHPTPNEVCVPLTTPADEGSPLHGLCMPTVGQSYSLVVSSKPQLSHLLPPAEVNSSHIWEMAPSPLTPLTPMNAFSLHSPYLDESSMAENHSWPYGPSHMHNLELASTSGFSSAVPSDNMDCDSASSRYHDRSQCYDEITGYSSSEDNLSVSGSPSERRSMKSSLAKRRLRRGLGDRVVRQRTSRRMATTSTGGKTIKRGSSTRVSKKGKPKKDGSSLMYMATCEGPIDVQVKGGHFILENGVKTFRPHARESQHHIVCLELKDGKVCGKPFKRQEHYNRHISNLHRDAPTIVCGLNVPCKKNDSKIPEPCTTKLTRSDNLQAHFKTHIHRDRNGFYFDDSIPEAERQEAAGERNGRYWWHQFCAQVRHDKGEDAEKIIQSCEKSCLNHDENERRKLAQRQSNAP